jgi:hypothetical protein
MTADEYAERVSTYRGFTKLATWFVIHVVVLLAGLYVIGIQNELAGGLFLIAASVVVLAYGIAKRLRHTPVPHAATQASDDDA